uniref:Uncharacterized protein n=1 Tax=Oryza nivara TaxID=4536 RepID=A0A0E0JAK0_ORYNI
MGRRAKEAATFGGGRRRPPPPPPDHADGRWTAPRRCSPRRASRAGEGEEADVGHHDTTPAPTDAGAATASDTGR